MTSETTIPGRKSFASFEWTPDLAVGVEAIDVQHQELFRRAGRLLATASGGGEASELLHLLGYLGDYVVTHFAAEEAFMVQVRYPDGNATSHRAEHARFTVKFKGMRDRFARAGADHQLADEVRRDVCDWLREHVSVTDRELASFMRARG